MASAIFVPSRSFADQGLILPPAGSMVGMSSQAPVPIIRGIKVDLNNPFNLDFIVDQGSNPLSTQELNSQTQRMVKYFLAILTIPAGDLWVNLSPYEKDRISANELGGTAVGMDMLAQDYLLKQLTASLTHPGTALGKEFWSQVYQKAQKAYGNTQIKVDTFNKVWIMPDKAVVYQKNNTAFIVSSHLKVMMEEDYTALKKNILPSLIPHSIASQVVRNIILPQIEIEVNTGKNFAMLRQIYNAFILALWYKHTLKSSILNSVYIGQDKTAGVSVEDTNLKEKIYQQYLRAYKKGVYNLIKEDAEPDTQTMVPHKYFSGGVVMPETTWAMIAPSNSIPSSTHAFSDVRVRLGAINDAMTAAEYRNGLNGILGFIETRKLESAAEAIRTGMKEFYGTELKDRDLTNKDELLLSLQEMREYEEKQSALIVAKIESNQVNDDDIELSNLLQATLRILEILEAHHELGALIAERDAVPVGNPEMELEILNEAWAATKTGIEQTLGELRENLQRHAGDRGQFDAKIKLLDDKIKANEGFRDRMRSEKLGAEFTKQIARLEGEREEERQKIRTNEKSVAAIEELIREAMQELETARTETEENIRDVQRRMQPAKGKSGDLELNIATVQDRMSGLIGQLRSIIRESSAPSPTAAPTVTPAVASAAAPTTTQTPTLHPKAQGVLELVPDTVRTKSDLAIFFRTRRTALEIKTIQQFADATGIAFGTLAGYENADHPKHPTDREQKIKKIAATLKLDEESLRKRIETIWGSSAATALNDITNDFIIDLIAQIQGEVYDDNSVSDEMFYNRIVTELHKLTGIGEGSIKERINEVSGIGWSTSQGQGKLKELRNANIKLRLESLDEQAIELGILDAQDHQTQQTDLKKYVVDFLSHHLGIKDSLVEERLIELEYATNEKFIVKAAELSATPAEAPQGDQGFSTGMAQDKVYDQLRIKLNELLVPLGQGYVSGTITNNADLRRIFNSFIFRNALQHFKTSDAVYSRAITPEPSTHKAGEGQHAREQNEISRKLSLLILFLISRDTEESGVREMFVRLYPKYVDTFPKIEVRNGNRRLNPDIKSYLERLWIFFGKDELIKRKKAANEAGKRLKLTLTQIQEWNRTLKGPRIDETRSAYFAFERKSGALISIETDNDWTIFLREKEVDPSLINAAMSSVDYKNGLNRVFSLLESESLKDAGPLLKSGMKKFYAGLFESSVLSKTEDLSLTLAEFGLYVESQMKLYSEKIAANHFTEADSEQSILLQATLVILKIMNAHHEIDEMIVKNRENPVGKARQEIAGIEQKEHASQSSLEAKLTALRQENEKHTTDIGEIQQQIGSISALIAKNTDLMGKTPLFKDAFTKKIGDLEEQKRSLNEQLQAIGTRMEQIPALIDQARQESEAELGKLQALKSEAQGRLAAAQESTGNFERNIAAKRQEISTWTDELKELLKPENEVEPAVTAEEVLDESAPPAPAEQPVSGFSLETILKQGIRIAVRVVDKLTDIQVPGDVTTIAGIKDFIKRRRMETGVTDLAYYQSVTGISRDRLVLIENPQISILPNDREIVILAHVFRIDPTSLKNAIDAIKAANRPSSSGPGHAADSEDALLKQITEGIVFDSVAQIQDDVKNQDIPDEEFYIKLVDTIQGLIEIDNQEKIKKRIHRVSKINWETRNGKGMLSAVRAEDIKRRLKGLSEDEVLFAIELGQENAVPNDKLKEYVIGFIATERKVGESRLEESLKALGYITNDDFVAKIPAPAGNNGQTPEHLSVKANRTATFESLRAELNSQLHLLDGQGYSVETFESIGALQAVLSGPIFRAALIKKQSAEAVYNEATTPAKNHDSRRKLESKIAAEADQKLTLLVLYLIIKNGGENNIQRLYLDLFHNSWKFIQASNSNGKVILNPAVRQYLQNLWILYGKDELLRLKREANARQERLKFTPRILDKWYANLSGTKRKDRLDAYTTLKTFSNILNLKETDDDWKSFLTEMNIDPKLIDPAMSHGLSTRDGGIDLNENTFDLQTRGEKAPVFHFDRAMVQMLHVDGFTPIIVKDTPIKNISLFLSANLN